MSPVNTLTLKTETLTTYNTHLDNLLNQYDANLACSLVEITLISSTHSALSSASSGYTVNCIIQIVIIIMLMIIIVNVIIMMIRLWAECIIVRPCTATIVSLTLLNYCHCHQCHQYHRHCHHKCHQNNHQVMGRVHHCEAMHSNHCLSHLCQVLRQAAIP